MLLTASLLCLTVCSQIQAQDQASLRRSDDPAGRCHYTFTVASPEESSCPGGSTSRGTMDDFQSRLTLLESLVSQLIAGSTGDGVRVKDEEHPQEAHSRVAGERKQLQQDKELLNRQVQELQRRLQELSQEADGLRQKPCRETPPPSEGTRHEAGPVSDPSLDYGNSGYQEMKAELMEVSAAHFFPEGNLNFTGCGEIVSVGDPVMHRKADSITGKYGVWMQDPDPPGPQYTNTTVWRINAVGKDVRQLFAYEDMDQLSKGFPMKVLILPEPVESTGAALYRGSLYYQKRLSRTLIRYDLASESVASRSDLPDAGFHGQFPYSWGGYTDIDLAVDERGLWAIYSTAKAKGAIIISQLDPDSLEVRKSWETDIRKRTVANAFMACGRLHTVASYTATDTTINFVFDTATGVRRAVAVPFRNRYHYNSMVDYNRSQRKLFAWDNFHMVTYDVKMGGAGS
ncbi:myocilin-like [Pholidichthys leucotaenia]